MSVTGVMTGFQDYVRDVPRGFREFLGGARECFSSGCWTFQRFQGVSEVFLCVSGDFSMSQVVPEVFSESQKVSGDISRDSEWFQVRSKTL